MKKNQKGNKENKKNLDTNKKGNHLDNLVGGAVQEGIGILAKNNPRIGSFGEYISKHIDEKALYNKIEELKIENAKYSKEKGIDSYESSKKLYKDIASYVASGEILDDKGKEVIFENNLEGKTGMGFFKRIAHKKKVKGEKYFNESMDAFEDLSALLSSGDYAKRMPELTKSVKTLQDMRFLAPALDVLKSHNLIDDKKYKFLQTQVHSQVKQGREEVLREIERYIVPEETQKVAAGILSFLGLGLILARSPGITGNAINVSELFSSAGSLIGTGFLLAGIVLFLVSGKIRRKKKCK